MVQYWRRIDETVVYHLLSGIKCRTGDGFHRRDMVDRDQFLEESVVRPGQWEGSLSGSHIPLTFQEQSKS